MAAVVGSPVLYTYGATSPVLPPIPVGSGQIQENPPYMQYPATIYNINGDGTVNLRVDFLDPNMSLWTVINVPFGSGSHTWQAVTLAT